MGLLSDEEVTKIKPQLEERLVKVKMVYNNLDHYVQNLNAKIDDIKAKLKICIADHKKKENAKYHCQILCQINCM